MPRRPRKQSRRRPKKGGADVPVEHSPGTNDEEELEDKPMNGGKKGKTSKKSKTKAKKGTRKGKKMNEFFKLLIAAKKKNAESFVYKGKTYKKKVGTKKNPKLVVYKKA
tara:strand:+ start:182 stop:508 length:327 start_codon:yes stop_codon:yes gene_type:complete